MTKRNLFDLALGFAFAGAVAQAAVFESSETEKAVQALGAVASSEIAFDQDSSTLKSTEANDLRLTIKQAQQTGKISEVKVVAWADREYPVEGTKASDHDIRLANDRADRVKRYIKQEFSVRDVSTYNMAKRPNTLQEILKTGTQRLKKTLQDTGAAPTSTDQTGPFGLNGKASEVLVLIYH